ncbi:hypothetical protein M409DRAFT_52374 [Zasmidium cellare ATCC 36951]|uniref:Uncharacterized protein n=1 Tax=Zasmidium cellare ATCC 36951 TaxID=1080233 RepID=A0A6A6CUM9_ZASCE|nr:uncharacterized protein M409DRAFT_52374 [Zasmidium cellare ATCC 36951]KAF2169890.1 hypothetical protein M409DRAFT_52374 [Zasmidium cellare ATCC 36951]
MLVDDLIAQVPSGEGGTGEDTSPRGNWGGERPPSRLGVQDCRSARVCCCYYSCARRRWQRVMGDRGTDEQRVMAAIARDIACALEAAMRPLKRTELATRATIRL